MVAIIDYDAGNIKSVEKALAYLGEETVVSRDPEVLTKADKVILPGVGSFGEAMENLHKYGLVPVIKDMINLNVSSIASITLSNSVVSSMRVFICSSLFANEFSPNLKTPYSLQSTSFKKS